MNSSDLLSLDLPDTLPSATLPQASSKALLLNKELLAIGAGAAALPVFCLLSCHVSMRSLFILYFPSNAILLGNSLLGLPRLLCLCTAWWCPTDQDPLGRMGTRFSITLGPSTTTSGAKGGNGQVPFPFRIRI